MCRIDPPAVADLGGLTHHDPSGDHVNLTKRLATYAASAALVAALLPLAASPAVAEVQQSSDAAGDTSTEDGPGPGQRTADIVGFRTNHGERRVTVRLDMADVRDGGEYYASVIVRTDAGARYGIYFGRSPFGKKRSLDVVRGSRAKGTLVRCRGAQARLLISDTAAQVSVPRRCLGNPGWVQTGALVETRPPQVRAGIYTDEARRNGGADEQRIKVGGRRLTSG